eukprot:3940991-Rhodomonas_salina.2
MEWKGCRSIVEQPTRPRATLARPREQDTCSPTRFTSRGNRYSCVNTCGHACASEYAHRVRVCVCVRVCSRA